MQRVRHIDTATSTFLNDWRRENFLGMYSRLHSNFQTKVSHAQFAGAFQAIDKVIGRLQHFAEQPMPRHAPILNERMFADPLDSPGALVVRRYRLQFDRSEGFLIVEIGREGEDIKIVGLGIDIPELKQPPLSEELKPFGIGTGSD